jgi:putative acetyltransferase
MHIRLANQADVVALGAIFRSAAEVVGPEAYSPAQVAVWSSFPENQDAFRAFILAATTFVAVEESQLLGFCGVEDDGRVASLYVRGDRGREGIGSKLLAKAISHAQTSNISRLYAEASVFSRPLFLKFGFVDTGTEVVQRGEVDFKRYLVAREL